ncbi:MAG TPA: hypothetical protein VH744_10445 [Terriglobales bacterium]
MQAFLQRHASEIKGVLSGFDRVRFLGTMRMLANVTGLGKFLSSQRVLLKDFKAWAQGLTDTILTSTEQLAAAAKRPIVYLESSQERKEDRALAIAEKDDVQEGLLCVLKCVEPCYSMTVGPEPSTRHLELRRRLVKCSHLYFYLRDRKLGLLNVRLQTWLPFSVHVCLNGREWLARRLQQARIAYEQRDNCFTDVADVTRAQRLLDQQLGTDWTGLLNRLLRQVFPAHASLLGPREMDYYWSAQETEWATDILFRSPESLAALFPTWRRHAMTHFASDDVLRFLGRCPAVHRYTTSEIASTLKTRPEGTRVRHAINGNSSQSSTAWETRLLIFPSARNQVRRREPRFR